MVRPTCALVEYLVNVLIVRKHLKLDVTVTEARPAQASTAPSSLDDDDDDLNDDDLDVTRSHAVFQLRAGTPVDRPIYLRA